MITGKLQDVISELLWSNPDFDTTTIEEIVVSEITVIAKQGKRIIDREIKVTMTNKSGYWKLLYID